MMASLTLLKCLAYKPVGLLNQQLQDHLSIRTGVLKLILTKEDILKQMTGKYVFMCVSNDWLFCYTCFNGYPNMVIADHTWLTRLTRALYVFNE